MKGPWNQEPVLKMVNNPAFDELTVASGKR